MSRHRPTCVLLCHLCLMEHYSLELAVVFLALVVAVIIVYRDYFLKKYIDVLIQ